MVLELQKLAENVGNLFRCGFRSIGDPGNADHFIIARLFQSLDYHAGDKVGWS